jgi:cytochrome c biogenesis protein CcmG, thiol:disulfide interchange protein DsbE
MANWSKIRLLAWATVVAVAPSAAAQMTASEVLARVSQSYRGLKTYEIHATETFTNVAGRGFDVAQTKLLLAVDAGGRLRLEREDAQNTVIVVSNGDARWSYAPALRQYTEQKVASGVVQDNRGDDQDAVSETQDVLVGHYRGIDRFGNQATLVRGAKVMSEGRMIDCYVVEIRSKDALLKMWVDKERFLVLRQDRTTQAGASAKLEVKQFETSGPLGADVFNFTPPAGASEVEVLDVPGIPASLIGKPAQEFRLRDLDGNEVAFSDLQGKVVLLDFWSTWCPPCRAELPAIAKLYAAYRGQDVEVLGVDDEDSDTVKRYLVKQGLSLPVLVDSNDKVHREYGCHAVPTVIVINRQGTVTGQYVGEHSEDELRAALRAAGAQPD